jgi:hypothetical protein
MHPMPLSRYWLFLLAIAGSVGFGLRYFGGHAWALWPMLGCAALVGVGIADLIQRHSALRRNYPILAHGRFMIESMRVELRQYLFESDTEETPFSRQQRSIVYQRAKEELDKRPFGTQGNVYADHYEWINHSLQPTPPANLPYRIRIGGSRCTQPYDAAVFNISAMSFGALSANAIRALNLGAKKGGFYHDTGEGSISRYHLEHGGDLVWEIGSGYFGCRNDDGTFNAERFRNNAALESVRMIEIKLSQGAKPGQGGIRHSIRPWDCCTSCRNCANFPGASRSASSWPLAMFGNGLPSQKPCTRVAFCPISLWSTAARAELAPHRSSSPTTSACHCAKP